MRLEGPMSDVRYFIFDIESVADGELVSRLRYPGENLPAAGAVARYRAELLAKYETDFIPLDLVALAEPAFRPHIITEHFWRGWERYGRPTLVSFNGRSFDVPLLELAAFRYGINLAGWFSLNEKSFDQPRHRYNVAGHLDLQEQLTNFGSTRFAGGLNLAANLLGKTGKMDVQGHMVQDMYEAGQLAQINDYCRCDVLDTYF